MTSPVTLAECLVVPYRLGIAKLQQDFLDLIVSAKNTVFVSIDREIGKQAAELRARYNTTLPDALPNGNGEEKQTTAEKPPGDSREADPAGPAPDRPSSSRRQDAGAHSQ